MEDFRVAIIGGEEMGDYDFFCKKCKKILSKKSKERPLMILSTIDAFVKEFSEKYHISVEYFNAEFGKYGKKALTKRRDAILSNCDAVILFEGSKKEHESYKKAATDLGIPLREPKLDDKNG